MTCMNQLQIAKQLRSLSLRYYDTYQQQTHIKLYINNSFSGTKGIKLGTIVADALLLCFIALLALTQFEAHVESKSLMPTVSMIIN